MIKFIIPKSEKKRFQDIFRFFFNNKCELCIFPEGLKWRNHCAEGIICKGAFVEYPFNFRRRLKLRITERKNLLNWFKNWEEKDKNIKIPGQ